MLLDWDWYSDYTTIVGMGESACARLEGQESKPAGTHAAATHHEEMAGFFYPGNQASRGLSTRP